MYVRFILQVGTVLYDTSKIVSIAEHKGFLEEENLFSRLRHAKGFRENTMNIQAVID
jgi:hypothetical protein